MSKAPRYWLIKSEPSAYSLEDLKNSPGGTDCWDGVRNYQARNYMRDDMGVGDRVLFYHSSNKATAIVGEAVVVREAYPDHTAWDPKDDHFDPRSTPDNPVWMMVDIRFVREFPRPLTLPELREMPALAEMVLLRKGMRLSIQTVTAKEYRAIAARAEGKGKP